MNSDEESLDYDVPETVLQFVDVDPRNALRERILDRNPSVRSRTDSEQTVVEEETEEERQRRENRKERNRAAARKCREKKIQRAQELEEEVDGLEDIRKQHLDEIAELQRQVASLQNLMHGHQCHLTGMEEKQTGQPEADTPTDQNELSFRALSDFHFEASEVNDSGELNTPVVDLLEVDYNL